MTTLHLRDGEVWYAPRPDGSLGITWYPFRADHPDAPQLVTDSNHEGIDPSGSGEAVAERLRTHFNGRDPRELVVVHLEREASAAEVEAVQRVFDELGTPAIVSPSIGRYSLVHPDWVLVIKAAAGVFTAGVLGKAGANAWDGLEVTIRRLYEERRRLGNANGRIELDEGERQIFFTEDVPIEAYRELADLPEEDTYHWDASNRRWRQL